MESSIKLVQGRSSSTYGLDGWVYIVCDDPSCKTVNKITVGKQHKRTAEKTSSVSSKSPVFDINTKAASGMLPAGNGETNLYFKLATNQS